MSKRLLVGTDGSPEAQVALRWAARFAAASEAELAVVSAWRPSFAEVDPRTHEELHEEAVRELDEQWCAPARDASVRFHSAVIEGDPRAVLLARADEEDADLIVVGARGATGSAHPLHLGSVAHHLIHHTERPLAAIPSLARTSPPARIVVGVDGSPGSAAAVQWCADNAPGLGAAVLAVYAELPLAEWVPHGNPRSWYRYAQQDCEQWATSLRDAGVPARSIVVEHEPARGLTEAAMREEADLLVVGSRGRGGFTGLRLGSTALNVLHRSGLPIVLVPSPSS